jgi:hypothetical protein
LQDIKPTPDLPIKWVLIDRVAGFFYSAHLEILLLCRCEFFLGVEETADSVEAAGFAEDDHAFK